MVSVVIPALNEGEVIAAVVRELPWDLVHECIVVDNGSTDTTAAEATSAGAKVVKSQRGYGRACAAGAAAADAASDILVFMDGDGSDVSSEMPQLLQPILAGDYDFVIGSRLRGKREPGSMLLSQVFAGWLAGVLLRLHVSREIHRHGAISRHSPRISGEIRYARRNLRLEPGDANAGPQNAACASAKFQ